jgi:glutamate synthase (NADPH/NADH) small chain
MGDPKGFLTLHRIDPTRRPVAKRVKDWQELYIPLDNEGLRAQGARCMDCGVPFCQGDTGCPVQNLIPDWNDLVYRDDWENALASLHQTNNFPEFTGRLCPAPCESACVLGIIDQPVTIRNIEQSIIDRGWDEGWVKPVAPVVETGKKVAVVGSGPAGMAAAQQLRRLGHSVTLFEKANRIGGLLRYGIPEFKMEKTVLDRRLWQLEQEGIVFRTGVDVGRDLPADALMEEFDAVCLTGGAEQARELRVPGRELDGVHLAMEYLVQQNHILEGDPVDESDRITAKGKRVIVIGGGDTGSDCVGTAHRQGAVEVIQLELLPQPPADRAASTPWPLWPMKLRTSHAHEEGGAREWSIRTTSLSGEGGKVKRLHAVRVVPDASVPGGFAELPDSEVVIEADLVVLAMGFTGVKPSPLLADLGVELDARGAVRADAKHRTSVRGVFAAGDMRRGASLIVWAIREGRDAARQIDRYLRKTMTNDG